MTSVMTAIPVTERILEDRTLVKGVIYCIEHTVSGKQYIGQTVTHRLNKGKYRPYGIRRRFAEHLSNAKCNTKPSQSTCLYNAIREQGAGAFTIQELEQCDIANMDDRERYYIDERKTLYPHGFNLTTGGAKTFAVVANLEKPPLNPPKARGGCTHRTEETRARMSGGVKAALSSAAARATISSNTKAQHAAAKAVRFAGVTIDPTKLDEYITVRKGFVLVRAGGQEARFASKTETPEVLVARAKEFLQSLIPSTTTPVAITPAGGAGDTTEE